MTRLKQWSAIWALIAAAAAVAPAHAQLIQEYEYAPDRIYQVHTGLGITTQIELSPNEQVVDFSSGFSNGWDLTRRDNVFYLKPKNVDVDTNLVIRTQTHSYIFELRVVATDWKALDQGKAGRGAIQDHVPLSKRHQIPCQSAARSAT